MPIIFFCTHCLIPGKNKEILGAHPYSMKIHPYILTVKGSDDKQTFWHIENSTFKYRSFWSGFRQTLKRNQPRNQPRAVSHGWNPNFMIERPSLVIYFNIFTNRYLKNHVQLSFWSSRLLAAVSKRNNFWKRRAIPNYCTFHLFF